MAPAHLTADVQRAGSYRRPLTKAPASRADCTSVSTLTPTALSASPKLVRAMNIACHWLHRRIDYCNSLLANSSQCALNRLQRVMNAAARLLCHSGRRASVSGLLRDRLHWLRVPERVEYKVCLLVFKALHGMAPNYLSELCRPNAEDTARSRLGYAAISKFHTARRTWKPCIWCRRADVLEQTSSRNPGKRLTAEFQVSA